MYLLLLLLTTFHSSVQPDDMTGQMFYTLSGSLYTWDGDAHTLLYEADFYGPVLSPNGQTLAVYSNPYDPVIYLMDVTTSELTELPTEVSVPEDPSSVSRHSRMVFSPDGTQVAYWEAKFFVRLMVHDIPSGETRILAPTGDDDPLPVRHQFGGAHPGLPPLSWGAVISYETKAAVDRQENRTMHLFDPATGERTDVLYSQFGDVYEFVTWYERDNGGWVTLLRDEADMLVALDPLADDSQWYRVDAADATPVIRLVNEPSGALRVNPGDTHSIITTDRTYMLPDDLHYAALSPGGSTVAVITNLTTALAAESEPVLALWQPDESPTPILEIDPLDITAALRQPGAVWGATEHAFAEPLDLTPINAPFSAGETTRPTDPVVFDGEIVLEADEAIDLDTMEIFTATTSPNDPWWDGDELWFRVVNGTEKSLIVLPNSLPQRNGNPDDPPTRGTCRGVLALDEYRTDLDLGRLRPDDVWCFLTSEGNPGYFYVTNAPSAEDIAATEALTIQVIIWSDEDES